MSRPAVLTHNKITTVDLASGRDIKQATEADIAENVQHIHGELWPEVLRQNFQTNTADPYIEPTSTSYVVNCLWRRRMFADNSTLRFQMSSDNAGSQAGTVKLEMASDAATYNTSATISAGAGPGWTTLDLPYDNSQARDTVILSSKEDATGAQLKIRSLTAWPKEITSIPAGKTSTGFLPMDTVDYAANEPLSAWFRQVQYDNLEILRKTRAGTIAAWSEDWNRAGSEYYTTTSSDFVKIAQLKFQSGIKQTALEVSVAGYRAGSTGSIALATGYMEDILGTQVEQALSAKGAAPYTSNMHDTADLSCRDNKVDVINVYLKSDGVSAAYLMGLCVWFKDLS
jgi:hypothetical protein